MKRWMKEAAVAAACVACVFAIGAGVLRVYAATRTETRVYERFHTVEAGETVWSICEKDAPETVDVRDMVRWTVARNRIFDPGNLPEGMTIIVPVVKTEAEK